MILSWPRKLIKLAERMDKKYYIKTYGCQMNVYDSVRMGDVLVAEGYSETQTPDDADVILLNTCHIREKAAEKVYSDIGRLRKIKEKGAASGREIKIGVAGCVAQAEGQEILRRAPAVDMVLGSQSYHKLPEMLSHKGRKKPVELEFPEVQKFDLLPEQMQSQGSSAFVSVQEGCDKFCTFCVVPYTRGGEYSRPVQSILDEVLRQVDGGAREVTLLGQNVNAYHGEDAAGKEISLGKLIEKLADIDGLERIRYTTSHPNDMDEELIQAHGSVAKLMPYLHLPVQAGSDKILKAMNRKHTAASYMDIINRLRVVRPDIAFSGDFIVGFPGETDADFEATMAVVEAVGYSSAYSFKYSPRPGTPAAGGDVQVEEVVKDERLQRLQFVLGRQQRAFNEYQVGKEMRVLLDRAGREEGQRLGRSPYMQSVHVSDALDYAGDFVDVRITKATQSSLKGELLDKKVAA